MKVLALITARGGSKGLPGKNIREFHGHPLIAWSISQAKNAKSISKILVSTDDAEIAKASRDYGAEVPFLRPEELSHDTASSVDVALHALDELEKNGEKFDVLLLLQPTSPLRTRGDLEGMIQELRARWKEADGVVTAAELKPSPLHALINVSGFLRLQGTSAEKPRQALDTFYASYGMGWAIKVEVLREKRSFHPEKLLPWNIKRTQAVDIDDLADFKTAEALYDLVKLDMDVPKRVNE